MHDSKGLVVITGGTQGIGKALVERFSAEGYPVATCARNKAKLFSLKKEIEEKYGLHIHTHRADLTVQKEITDFIKFIMLVKKPLELDILINNTGVFLPGEVLTEEAGTLEKMLNTNLLSAYYLTRGIAPTLITQERGHIFNVCSVASLKAYPNGGSYSISKFAMYGFSQALREEFKHQKVKVTSVLAGAVKTPSWEGVDLPDSRFMKPEDIAETIFNSYKLSDRTVVEDIVLRPQLGDI